MNEGAIKVLHSILKLENLEELDVNLHTETNIFSWRRERDLNPRNPLRVDGLAIRCITALPSLHLM